MAGWLEEVVREVNREFDELPDWKRTTEAPVCKDSRSSDGRAGSAIQEPRSK